MHVLYLCDEYPPPVVGGIGQVIRLLAEGLVRRGHRATVVGQYWGQAAEYSQNGVSIIKLARPRKYRLTRNDLTRRYLLARAVTRLVRKREVDLVESPSYMGDGAFLPSGKGVHVHHVLRVHGTDSVRARILGARPRRFSAYLESRVLRVADSVVLVGKAAGRKYLSMLGHSDRPHAIIANPVDTSIFRPLETTNRSDNVLLFIGRIDERKGAIPLARALPAILQKLPKLAVRFAGAESHFDPDSLRSGKDHVLDLVPAGLHHRLAFLGQLEHEQLVREINDATVCILPSLIEDFPCAVLEVMSCGVPVIASRRAHGEEVLSHFHSGILVDPVNTTEIEKAVTTLFRDTSLRARLASNARDLAKRRCDIEPVVDINIAYYESCLRGEPLTGELLPLWQFVQAGEGAMA